MKRRRGSTFIEVIVAMLVIGIAVVCSLEFFVYCQKSFIRKASLTLTAANFARETLERLYFRDPSDPALNAGDHSDDLPAAGNYKLHCGARTYTVTDLPDYKVVQVTVEWNQ